MELMDLIRKRQSVRKFKDEQVKREDLLEILEAARLAPSGKNIQNWHFVIVTKDEHKEAIGRIIVEKNEAIACKMDEKDPDKGLRFRKFVKNFTLFSVNAPVLIVTFASTYYPSGYHEYILAGYPEEEIQELFKRNPGMQNIGAALENMSLRAVELGYGSCWMTGQNYAAGELETFFKDELGFHKDGYFLCAMLALGVPEEGIKSPGRMELDEIVTFL